MNSIEIKIDKNWLTSGYYVYVVSIVYDNQTYFYIGQTGDNYHQKARAPLYRIGGHFAKGTSTENQIIKYFKTKILANENIANSEMETRLLEANISYKFWKIEDFDTSDSPDAHKNKRMKVQAVEHFLIFHLQQEEGNEVLNGTVTNEISASKQKYFKGDLSFIAEKGSFILKELGYEK